MKRPEHHWLFYKLFLTFVLALVSHWSFGQIKDSLPPSRAFEKLNLEELMGIEVNSVSKHPGKLNESASAVQVITQKDIRSSVAKTFTEAFRLAPNLQVAQVGQHLLDNRHPEFLPSSASPREIDRSTYRKIVCRV